MLHFSHGRITGRNDLVKLTFRSLSEQLFHDLGIGLFRDVLRQSTFTLWRLSHEKTPQKEKEETRGQARYQSDAVDRQVLL